MATDKIRNERIVTIIFLVLGSVSGIIANFLKDPLIAIPLAAVIYVVSFFGVYKIFKENKINPVLTTSLVTYLFLLFIVWIVLYTLKIG